MNRVVVLTGASSGLGRALAHRVAKTGDSLVLVARRREALEQVALECGAKAIVGSIADAATWAQAAECAAAAAGGEIVLVNNAGVALFGSYADSEFEAWREVVQVNLLGAMGLTHALLPAMLARRAGRVVNILSIAVKTGLAGTAAYSASKAGLEGFSRAMSAEYRPQGITITNIYPGAANTSIWDNLDGHPPRDQMIPEESLADTVFDVLQTPRDRVIEEIVVTPPRGIL